MSQTSDADAERRVRLRHVARIGPQRRPELGVHVRRLEVRAHHAEDDMRCAVDRHRASDGRRVAAEEPLPRSVAQDDKSVAVHILVRCEHAAQFRTAAKDGEEAGRDAPGLDDDRLARSGEAAIARPEDLEAVQRARSLTEPDEVERVKRVSLPRLAQAWRQREDAHEAIAVGKRQRPEHRRVHDGEDGGADTGDQRQGHRDQHVRARTTAKAAKQDHGDRV